MNHIHSLRNIHACFRARTTYLTLGLSSTVVSKQTKPLLTLGLNLGLTSTQCRHISIGQGLSSKSDDMPKLGRQKYWKEAASLMIVAVDDPENRANSNFDYRILFLERQGGENTFGGSSVFPGGVVDPADFSPNWLQHFQKLGINSLDKFGWAHMDGKPRSGPIAAVREHGILPNDVAFRICAIRETFEESGILIVDNKENVTQSIKDMSMKNFVTSYNYTELTPNECQEWQERVNKDASQFLLMCQELDVFPNLWSLFEISNSRTPRSVDRRFDVIFYVCTLDSLPVVHIDEKEMANSQWLTPAESLELHSRGDIHLVPPQIFECGRLLDFPNLADVEAYAAKIMDEGMDVCFPVGFYLKDCLLHTYLGDDCFPPDVSFASIKPNEISRLDETEEENLKRVKNLHRITFYSEWDLTFRCNIKLPHGQHPPRDIDMKDWHEK